jgi:signal peptidase I
MKRPIIPALFVLICATCAAVIPIQPVRVEGTAMEPALKDGDRIIIDRNFEKLERGDIVVFYFRDDQRKSYINRIVALPGETVEIRDGKIFVAGKTPDEPYVDPKNDQSKRSMTEIKLAGDAYFVMGDNRDNASDSRLWGPVPRKLIYGKYVKKYLAAGP